MEKKIGQIYDRMNASQYYKNSLEREAFLFYLSTIYPQLGI